MQNNTSKINTFLLIILVILAGILVFRPYFNNKEVAYTPTPMPEVVDHTPTQQNTNQVNTSTVSPSVNSNLVKTQWGISFLKDSKWIVNSDTGNQIKLVQNTGGGSGDTMTIDYIVGNTVTDTDAKFGNVTYYYDSAKQSWMKIAQDEQSAATLPPVAVTPDFYTVDQFPVFRGTGRWLTNIVALSHTTFLKINISGGGFTQPLTDLVKTIKKI